MSLSLAIDQIMRGTWWYENDRSKPSNHQPSAETVAMRQKILEWLRAQGGKVQGMDIQRHFGLTNSQLWHYLDPMVNAGLVRKFKPRHDRSLLEAA